MDTSQRYTLKQYERDFVISWVLGSAAIILSSLSAISFFLAWLLDSLPWLGGGLLSLVLCGVAVSVSMEAEYRMNQGEIP